MRSLVESVRAVLDEAEISNAQREAEWIVEAATGLTRAELPVAERDASTDERERALVMAGRRRRGEPLQYVTGVSGFRNLTLEVGPGVFIPRPETETLVERALAYLPQGGTVLDVGTGSGAVALAVAQERPDAEVWGTEVSSEALEWAERNRERLGLDVTFVQGDLFGGLPGRLRTGVDVIVSNPPYVPKDFSLGPEVADHEPSVALFGGDTGLTVIERLVSEARSWLRSGGCLVFEIAEVQRDAVPPLLIAEGFISVQVTDDLTGRPRIAEGIWTSPE